MIDLNNILLNSIDRTIKDLFFGVYTCRFRDAANGVDKPIDTTFILNYSDSKPLFRGMCCCSMLLN